MSSDQHLHRSRPELIAGVNRPPEVKVREVIEVRFRRGEGCCEGDAIREVTAYFDLQGNFLAEDDPRPTQLSEPG